MTKYAIVYLTKDQSFDIVPVTNIQRFTEETWQKDKVYKVKWSPGTANSDDDSQRPGYSGTYTLKSSKSVYPAFVIKISDSEDELAQILENDKRLCIPNIHSAEPITTDEGDSANAMSQLAKEKKEQAATQTTAMNARLKTILAKKRKAPLAMKTNKSHLDEDTSSDDDSSSTKQARFCQMKKKISELQAENATLRTLNVKLQSRFLDKIETMISQGTRKGSDFVGTTSKTNPKPSNPLEREPLTEDVDLQSTSSASTAEKKVDYLLTDSEVALLDRKRKPSMLIKNMAVHVFGTETLRKSSLDGTPPHRCQGVKVARPALCAERVNYIKSCVERRYNIEAVSKVHRCLLEKIADLRKMKT